jgi:hypothetical protein
MPTNNPSPATAKVSPESPYTALLVQYLAEGRTRFDCTLEVTHRVLDRYLFSNAGPSPGSK